MEEKCLTKSCLHLLIGQKFAEKERRDAIIQNLDISHVLSLSVFCFLDIFDMIHQLLIRIISPEGDMKESCHRYRLHKTLAEMILLCL